MRTRLASSTSFHPLVATPYLDSVISPATKFIWKWRALRFTPTVATWLGITGGCILIWQFCHQVSSLQEENELRAWQVIAQGEGKRGDIGRTRALEILANSGISIDHVNVIGASLKGVVLREANLSNARFDSTILDGADLRGARLDSARFDGARLHRVLFGGARLSGTSLAGAKLNGADFASSRRATTVLELVDLTGADLENTDFGGVHFAGSLLKEASNLSRAIFSDAEMAGADLRNTNLRAMNLVGANLSRARLSGAYLDAAHLKGANLEAAFVDSISLNLTDLRDTNLNAIQGWRTIRTLRGANIFGVRQPPLGFVRWASDTMGATCISSDSIWKHVRDGGDLRSVPCEE
jgi:uncharacterized protein YjbI with pentapeptide repeats